MWEGAELCIYINGESYSYTLTDIQMAIIGKILGLQVTENSISCYSDDTLKKLTKIKGNPLNLQEI